MNFYLFTVLFILVVSVSGSDKKPETRITSFVDSFSSILAALSAVKVLSVVTPFLLKFAVLPLILLMKILYKPLFTMGLTLYLMVAFTPLILAKSGLTTPEFESRSASNSLLTPLGDFLSTNLSVVLEEIMNFFDVDNDECKMEITCRMGRTIVNEHPFIYMAFVQSGAKNWVQNKYMANMIKSMTESAVCENSCQSLSEDDYDFVTTKSSLDPSSQSSVDSKLNEIFEWLGK